ncbi:MAG: hypothetical protein P8049_10870 [Gemmatimonadota bacterium]
MALDEGVPTDPALRPPPHLSQDAWDILEGDLELSRAESRSLFESGAVLPPGHPGV